MSPKETEFDALFKEEGGLFKIHNEDYLTTEVFNSIKEDANGMINYVRRTYPYLPDIYVDFINDTSLNACADKTESGFFIGINIGVFFILQNIFFRIFASSRYRPTIGDINNEENVCYKIEKSDTVEYSFTKPLVIPKDKMRYEYAFNYTKLAIGFVVLHEIGHVVRGHVGLLKSKGNFHKWEEIKNVSANDSQELETWIYQTLEMDADSFATNHCYLLAELGIKNFNLLNQFQQLIYKDFESFYFHWTYSVCILLKVFGFEEFKLEHVPFFVHPPALIRMQMIHANLVVIFDYHKLQNAKSIREVVAGCVKGADLCFDELLNETPNDYYIKSHEATSEYVKTITDNWNKVRPMLEPFAFGVLPPLKIVT